jgi:hypothetical protein
MSPRHVCFPSWADSITATPGFRFSVHTVVAAFLVVAGGLSGLVIWKIVRRHGKRSDSPTAVARPSPTMAPSMPTSRRLITVGGLVRVDLDLQESG